METRHPVKNCGNRRRKRKAGSIERAGPLSILPLRRPAHRWSVTSSCDGHEAPFGSEVVGWAHRLACRCVQRHAT